MQDDRSGQATLVIFNDIKALRARKPSIDLISFEMKYATGSYWACVSDAVAEFKCTVNQTNNPAENKPKGQLLELYKQQDRDIFDGEYNVDSIHPSLPIN